MRIERQTLFAVFGTALRSIQDPSTDARDNKDHFSFQRSFGSHGCAVLSQDDRVKHFCQLKRIFANKILAQAKPRFCAGAPNLRGSARAGKVKAVRVLQWCAPKSAPPRKTPAAPRCKRGQRGCHQITAFRRRQLAEERVSLFLLYHFPAPLGKPFAADFSLLFKGERASSRKGGRARPNAKGGGLRPCGAEKEGKGRTLLRQLSKKIRARARGGNSSPAARAKTMSSGPAHGQGAAKFSTSVEKFFILITLFYQKP